MDEFRISKLNYQIERICENLYWLTTIECPKKYTRETKIISKIFGNKLYLRNNCDKP
jgi:hypothetical protein